MNWTGTITSTAVNFADGDHITGNVVFSNGCTVTADDSATIYVDGNYYIQFAGTCIVNIAKTQSTIVTFCANNRTVQGKNSFWNYIMFNGNSGTTNFSYVKIQDSAYSLYFNYASGVGNGSGIHHIWHDSMVSTGPLGVTATPFTLKNIYFVNSNCSFAPGTSVAKAKLKIQKLWADSICPSFANTDVDGMDITVSDCVFKRGIGASSNLPSHSVTRYINNYLNPAVYDTALFYVYASNTTLNKGKTYVTGETCGATRVFYSSAGKWTSSLYSSFNDFINERDMTSTTQQFFACDGTWTSSVSNNDYMLGANDGNLVNPDTDTTVPNSAHVPPMYTGLTARTNPRNIRNKQLYCVNVVSSSITQNSATITFDCFNSHSGSVVLVDSANGQKILYVSKSTSDFVVGEEIEIGYGTDRFETASISSMTSGSITLDTNLVYYHSGSQKDTVKKELRHMGLGFVKYGTTSGTYTMRTSLPPYDKWGLIYTELETTQEGRDWINQFKKWGHSVTLNNLQPGTKYYFKTCVSTPLNEICESSEYSLTTSPTGSVASGESNYTFIN